MRDVASNFVTLNISFLLIENGSFNIIRKYWKVCDWYKLLNHDTMKLVNIDIYIRLESTMNLILSKLAFIIRYPALSVIAMHLYYILSSLLLTLLRLSLI